MAKKQGNQKQEPEENPNPIRDYWRSLESQRKLEISAIVVFTGALVLSLALISHHQDDLLSSPPTIENWIGTPGAYASWALHFLVGYAAWLTPTFLIGWGILIVRGAERPKHYLSRSLGAFCLTFSLCGLLALSFESPDGESLESALKAGGLIGAFLAQVMGVFGRLGAYIVLCSISLVALLLTTEFLFSTVYRKLREAAAERRMRREEESLQVALEDDEEERIVEQFRPEKDRTKTVAEGMIRMAPVLDEAEISMRLDEEEVPSITLQITSPETDVPLTDSGDRGSRPPDRIDDSSEPLRPTKKESPEPKTQEEAEEERRIRISTLQTPTIVEEAGSKSVVAGDPERLEEYRLPPLSLLKAPEGGPVEIDEEEMYENSRVLEETLAEFGIKARVTDVKQGPVITRYEFVPPPGVKVSRITSLADNLALRLKATRLRMLAPIPGKAAIGVEIPNSVRREVRLREILASKECQSKKGKLVIGLGMTLSGEPYVADLEKMPHLLIAGATGSGKSVCMNTIISTIIYRASPEEVKILLIDPKRVEMKLYNDIPHLISPVVVDARRAGGALKWVIHEMEQRYIYLSKAGVRDLHSYNRKRKRELHSDDKSENPVNTNLPGFLPQIVVFIDELADLMMVAKNDVESMIVRLAQLARAVGIHLVIATQRPSVNVITGIIKANLPARIAFQVSSKVDSRTILDGMGAEALLGKGDMLFAAGGGDKPIRLQGSLIETEEAEALCDFVRSQRKAVYLQEEFEEPSASGNTGDGLFSSMDDGDDDDLYREAVEIVLSAGVASTSLLQRRLKIGYGRAARLIDIMHEAGIVGPPRGSKPRKVLVGAQDEMDD